MTKPRLRRNNPSNFTLLEMLIAVSLFATIVVALYSALSVGISAWKRGDQGSNLHQKARVILDTMISDIRKCVYFSYIQFVGKANELYFPVAIPVTDANKEAKGTFDTNVFKITYLLDRGSYRDRYKTLMRKQETFLQSLDPSKVKPREFASGVVELSFEYCYKEAMEEEEDVTAETAEVIYWTEEWKLKNKIPKGVKIKLVLVDESTDEDNPDTVTFERTVFIPQGTLEVEPEEEEKLF